MEESPSLVVGTSCVLDGVDVLNLFVHNVWNWRCIFVCLPGQDGWSDSKSLIQFNGECGGNEEVADKVEFQPWKLSCICDWNYNS